MRKIQVITDSCADLSKELRDLYNIDYAKMRTIYNGKELPASLDFEYYSAKQLYDLIASGERVTTTQVPSSEFNTIFKKYLDMGMDIIYIACALPLSASVNEGQKVAEELLKEYKDAKIVCINSINSSMGEGLIAIKCAELVKEGLSIEEVASKIEEFKTTVNQFCTVASLDCLKRAGRVTGSSAFFGNLFGVKPIIISNKEGQNLAVKKVKGRNNSLLEIVKMAKESALDIENQTVYINHADALEDAIYCKELCLKEGFKDAYIGLIGPIIGSCIGNGAIAVFVTGKKVEI